MNEKTSGTSGTGDGLLYRLLQGVIDVRSERFVRQAPASSGPNRCLDQQTGQGK